MTEYDNTEYKAWRDAMAEFRAAVGDPNDYKYNALITSIQLWGEQLHQLRQSQSAQQQTRCLEIRLKEYATIKNIASAEIEHETKEN